MWKAANPDVNDAVDKWLKQAWGNNITVTGALFQSEAESVTKELGHEDFKRSQGWLTRFKNHKKLKFRTISEEAKSVNGEDVEQWKTN